MNTKLITVALSAIVAVVSFLGTEKLYSKTSDALPVTEERVKQIVLDTIKKHPEVLMQAIQDHVENQQKAQMEKAKMAVKEKKDQIFSSRHPSAGNLKGDIQVAIFYDYRCGHCKHMAPVLNEVIKGDPKVSVSYIDVPIFGEESLTFAKMGLAAAKQGRFIEVHEALMAAPGNLKEEDALALIKKLGLNMDQLKKDMASPEIEKALKDNMALAQSIGLSGTPALIIGDDDLIPGAMSKEALIEMLKTIRQAKK